MFLGLQEAYEYVFLALHKKWALQLTISSEYVGGTYPFELHTRPYGDVLITPAGDVLKTSIGDVPWRYM